MENIYRDISERTNGSIYIGVVGPVRTGKSTIIKRFMESLVLPNIANVYDKERARDEMPQSAAGKTVMTTEPKFVPDDPVEITIGDNATFKVKMVDCVGYIVPEALGHIENGTPRMVLTPWSTDPMPFEAAAELGTRKVINDHSTIGLVVTTDGSIGEISRDNYIEAEERVINELKKLHKPFAIVLNSATPNNEASIALGYELEKKYDAPVALINALETNSEDIKRILELILLEFPVRQISVNTPRWTTALDENHWLSQSINNSIFKCASKITKTGDIKSSFNELLDNEYIGDINLDNIDLGKGNAAVSVNLAENLYYDIMAELTGFEIEDDEDLILLLQDLAKVKGEYDKVSKALSQVYDTGYGIVMPDIEDLKLEEPEIFKHGGSYGVKLKASAPSVHMIKADIETEINPMVGSEQQSEELVKFMLKEFESDPKKIWGSNIFGKTLYELVTEGLHTKLAHMPDDARSKLSETLQKIINEGSGGLICIIL
jgi:stage IV sporulation protein A